MRKKVLTMKTQRIHFHQTWRACTCLYNVSSMFATTTSVMIIVMAFGIFGLRWLFFCARIVGGQCAAPDRAAA